VVVPQLSLLAPPLCRCGGGIERHSGRSVTSEGSWLSVADGLIVAVHLDVVWMRGQPLFCAGSRPVLASGQLPL
jgi:hypothetical protein